MTSENRPLAPQPQERSDSVCPAVRGPRRLKHSGGVAGEGTRHSVRELIPVVPGVEHVRLS